MDNKLTAIIESAEKNYSAYLEGLDGIVATGNTLDAIKNNLLDAIKEFIDSCNIADIPVPEELKGDFSIEFKMDVKSLLNVYSGIFTKAGMERLTGINQKQLWHYAKGRSVPRRSQVKKIEDAIHRLGRELQSVYL